MKAKKFIKILAIIAAIIALFFAILVGLAYYFEKEIKAYTITQIERKIGVEIKVEDIQFSFIRKFPMASLWFKNVQINGSGQANHKSPLFVAKRIYLNFNVKDVFNKNYTINKIEIENASVKLFVNSEGKDNYHILKPSSDTTNIFVSLENISLKKTTFSYQNEQIKQRFELFIERNSSSLSFDDDALNLGFNGNGVFANYFIDQVQLIHNKSFTLNTRLKYSSQKNSIYFENSSIKYELIDVKINGNITQLNEEPRLEINFSSSETDFDKIISELDEDKQELLKPYKIAGKLAIKASAKGLVSAPEIKAEFGISNTEITINGTRFYNTLLKAEFTNGKNRSLESCIIEAKEFKTTINNQLIQGSFKIIDLRNSKITALIHGKLDLASMSFLLPSTEIAELTGIVDFDTKLYCEFNQLLTNATLNMESFGISTHFKLSAVDFVYVPLKLAINDLNSTFDMNNTGLSVADLSFNSKNKNLKFDGKIDFNLNQFLLNKTQSIWAKGNLSLSSFDMKLLALFNSRTKKETNSSLLSYSIVFNTKVDTFIWDEFTSYKNQGLMRYDGNSLTFTNLQLSSCDGLAKGDVKINFLPNGNTGIESSSQIENINISKLFSSFKDFGQQTLTSRNLKGSVNSKINYSAIFDAQDVLIPNSTKATAAMSIINGELNGVKELNALSSYTKVKDFSSIKFSELSNTINIRNDSIFIPEMEIKSDKLTMNVYGIHSFENAYDYHFKVLLTEILAKKIERVQATEFGDVIDDQSGKTTIFLHLYGKGDNFTVKYDKAAVGKKIQSDLKKERQNIKTILKTEFKLNKNDSLSQIETNKEQEIQKKQESGKFVIEWEEK